MKKRDRDSQEQLTRLLQSAGPATIPTLQPDPGLPARIRAMDRQSAAPHGRAAAPRPRWAWLSLGTAVSVMALLAGGVLGYRAGTALTAADAAEVADSETGQTETSALLDAWSQDGFEEDLRGWNNDNGEVNP